jgi:hypothetical protein
VSVFELSSVKRAFQKLERMAHYLCEALRETTESSRKERKDSLSTQTGFQVVFKHPALPFATAPVCQSRERGDKLH